MHTLLRRLARRSLTLTALPTALLLAALVFGGRPADAAVSPPPPPPTNPAIDLETATNGQDADTPTGPTVTIGDVVMWTYVVTNTGDVELSGVEVTDDQGVTVSCPAMTLSVGESMSCTASGTAEAGQYANLGTATAEAPDETEISDSDPSHYFGEPPSNAPPTADAGDDQTVFAGQVVTFDGSASSNPDGDGLTFEWALAPSGTLGDADTATPTFCAVDLTENGQDYMVTLTVSDGELSDSDEVDVTVISVDAALSDLVEAVNAEAALNRGLVRALTVKLEQAADLLSDGKTAEALAVLADYEQQLADLVAEGVLEDAGPLSASAVIAVVASPCTAGSAIAGADAAASRTGDATASEGFALSAVYPNPFSASATVGFDAPEAADVRVVVYDVLGREVAVLADGPVEAGRHEVVLEAGSLPTGTYLVRMTTEGGLAQTQRITLMR